MRPPFRSLVVASLLCVLGSCSEESAAPVAPAPAAAAAKPKPKKAELMTASLEPSPVVTEALAHATKEREKNAAVAKSAPAQPAAPVVRPLPKPSAVHGALDTAKLGSRGLLHWLPPGASLVLRLPHVESLGEIRRRTSLGALMQNPAVMMALCAPDGPLGELNAKIHAQVPELEALLEKLPELQGELVVGLSHLEPAGEKPKVTAALAFDAGAGADELQKLLDPLLARLQKSNERECGPIEGAWGLVGWCGESCFEVRRFGNVITAQYGDDPEFGHGFQPESESANFASTQLVASASDLNAEHQGVAEFYVHMDPLWSLVRAEAPAQAQTVLQQLGLFGVHGAALEMGLGKKGMAESHTWSAPGHSDIVSQVFASAPANRELARWIPADAASAGLYLFDLKKLYDTIVSLLPESERAEMQQSLAQWKKQTRIDLAADVIGNFGPSFALVSRGDAFGLSGGPAGMCLAIETHDDDKVGELIGKLAPLLPPALKRRNTEFAGHPVLTYDLPAMGMAISSISLCRVDGALLVATDEKLLERCLLAGKEPGIKQADLAAALQGEDVIGATLSAPQGELPATVAVLRADEAGLSLSSKDGAGSLGSGCVAILPVCAAIAIPKLMSARLVANESAAIAGMRSIASGEAQIESAGLVDRDRDGFGEYGSLDDLCGAARILDWRDVHDGIATRSGYHYTVYLPKSADDAEVHWIGYAWPMDAGKTGNRVFVVDQEGDMLVCTNPGGAYSGLAKKPALDACLPKDAKVDRASGKPYAGRDGLTWQLFR